MNLREKTLSCLICHPLPLPAQRSPDSLEGGASDVTLMNIQRGAGLRLKLAAAGLLT